MKTTYPKGEKLSFNEWAKYIRNETIKHYKKKKKNPVESRDSESLN